MASSFQINATKVVIGFGNIAALGFDEQIVSLNS
jgi:hypothetical protein